MNRSFITASTTRMRGERRASTFAVRAALVIVAGSLAVACASPESVEPASAESASTEPASIQTVSGKSESVESDPTRVVDSASTADAANGEVAGKSLSLEEMVDQRREAARAALRARHAAVLAEPGLALPGVRVAARNGERDEATGVESVHPVRGVESVHPVRGVESVHPVRLEPPVVDLGEVMPDSQFTVRFKLINEGNEPVDLMRVMRSGSTTGGPRGARIVDEHEVSLGMAAGSRQGVSHDQRVTFTFDGHLPLVATVRFRTKLFIAVEPELINVAADQTEPPRVTLRSADGQHFAITGVDPAGVAAIPEGEALSHELELDIRRWRLAGSPTRISINTSHPELRRVSVMIRPVRPAATGPGAPPDGQ